MPGQQFNAMLREFPRPLPKKDTKKFLAIFGYHATDSGEGWAPGVGPGTKAWFPNLHIKWIGSDREDLHAFYTLECTVASPGKREIKWRTARRFSEIKDEVYQTLNQINETDVDVSSSFPFKVLQFERLLHGWLSDMAKNANTGKFSPYMVAVFLLSLSEKRVDVPLMLYLRQYGYHAVNTKKWWRAPPDAGEEWPFPEIEITVDGHDEANGHTQYHIRCSLNLSLKPSVSSGKESPNQDAPPVVEWTSDRRLKQIREDWYNDMDNVWPNYKELLEEPFAGRGGFSGTTAALNNWMGGIARCINSRQAPPLFVANTMVFLGAPGIPEGITAVYGRPIEWDVETPPPWKILQETKEEPKPSLMRGESFISTMSRQTNQQPREGQSDWYADDIAEEHPFEHLESTTEPLYYNEPERQGASGYGPEQL